MISYHRTKTDEELNEILALQEQNLFKNVSDQEKLNEGFVTLKHDFKTLKKMNNACAHCVAKNNGKIVGFALSMLQEHRNDVALLIPMFDVIDSAINTKKVASNYMLMGQICIDKSQRGKGVFRGLYTYMANQMKNNYNAIITEVDSKNIRSSNAHKSVGFQLLEKYTANNQDWEIIFLNL